MKTVKLIFDNLRRLVFEGSLDVLSRRYYKTKKEFNLGTFKLPEDIASDSLVNPVL